MKFSKLNCCGIAELHGIQEYEDRKVESLIRDMDVRNSYVYYYYGEYDGERYIIFSCEDGYTIGDRLAKFLESKKLARVKKMPSKVNVNSGNKIHVYVATIRDIDKFKDFINNCHN